MNGTNFRTAVAAILAGVLYFAGQAGELVFSASDDGDAVFVALGVAGIVALGVALWGLRDIVSGRRRGRIGIRLALAGFALLAPLRDPSDRGARASYPRTSSSSPSVSCSRPSASSSSLRT